ncbi:4507_t:CDS:2 [Entrophospora sp. SA101]|nr:12357_t:CDS:2 [Entrophospora candida]CAG8623472.1 9397_t:CDS:2 [Entrophospora candida]CAJ0833075.1 4507_t:CDS:2 [Entrophospora sp. SA101]
MSAATPTPLSYSTPPPKDQSIIDEEPYLYLIIFLMVIVFFSGICWIFCCGTCVGQDLLKLMGLRRFLPDDVNSFRINSEDEDDIIVIE